jgi:hypothetical protein
MDKVEQRAKKAAEQVAKVGHTLLGLGAVLTGLAAIAVKAAVAEEDVKDQLDALYGSAEAGSRVLGTLRGIAAKTGIDLAKLGQGVTAITTYFGDNEEQTKRLIGPLADLAKYMGTDIPAAAAMVGRAFAGGASDTIALRGPVLSLLKGYINLHYGISDITKMDLPQFREALLKFLTDPTTKFAGHAEAVAKGLGGTFDRLKVKLSEVSASFGVQLAPSIGKALDGLIRLLDWFGKLPEPIKAVVTVGGAFVGVLATLLGGLMSLLPKLLETTTALRAMGLAVSATKLTVLGIIGVIGAAAAATYLWTTRINENDAAQNKGALVLDRLARAVHQATKGTAEYYMAHAAYLEAVAAQTKGADESVEKLQKRAAAERELASGLLVAAASQASANTNTDAYLVKQEQVRLSLQRVRDLLYAPVGGEAIPGGANVPAFTADVTEAAKSTIDWLGALQQAAGAAGSSLGTMFADMAAGAETDLGSVIVQIGKLIAKLLIMAALYAIPGVGPILSQFAGGFLGAVGFDNPTNDTKAFRWGFDFARQFHQGISASVTGGLGLPSMQPAALAGLAGGGMAFDIHVHEPGPYTNVEVVRRGVSQMSDNEAFGLFRNKLGRASDRWGDR